MKCSESPEWVRLSCAAAITLGFERGFFYRNARLTCINILMMYSGGCKANCLYCGQASSNPGSSECKNLIRVNWPAYRLDDVIEGCRQNLKNINRVCVSTITHPKAPNDLLTITKKIHKELDIPISVLITPTLIDKDCLKEIKSAGAQMVGIAVDAATPELFFNLRGKNARSPHTWDRYISGLREAVEVVGEGKAGCHLIVGLGETEREMVSAIQMVRDIGGRTHLFSFFPEPESALKNRPQPPLGQYRRVQLARFLIDWKLSRYEYMKFNNSNQIIDFGVDRGEIDRIIESGKPFETSGCPHCNRPFANERPSQPIRNFPFKPTANDIEDIKRQIWLYEPFLPLILK